MFSGDLLSMLALFTILPPRENILFHGYRLGGLSIAYEICVVHTAPLLSAALADHSMAAVLLHAALGRQYTLCVYSLHYWTP